MAMLLQIPVFAFATLISLLDGFNKAITWVNWSGGANILQDMVLQNECRICPANQVSVVQYPRLLISFFLLRWLNS